MRPFFISSWALTNWPNQSSHSEEPHRKLLEMIYNVIISNGALMKVISVLLSCILSMLVDSCVDKLLHPFTPACKA